MPSTRASARLAKATKTKGKRAKEATKGVDDMEGHDDDYEQAESEVEEKEPLRKRQRTTAKPTKAVTRKKQVRGKQGRLAGLVNMPIDIFTEVASHLLPGDIISLARSNKFFRNLLMHRSAIHIWHGAMKNVEELPPCPSGMSEPHYLALLFSKTCSMCGAPARMNMDPVLLVRLCGACRDTSLMSFSSVPMTVMPWAIYSGTIAPQKRRQAGEYALRDEVATLLNQYEEKKQSSDKTALQAWTQERREIIDARRAQALVLAKFLASMEWGREQELGDLKDARQSEIKRRLTELGWAKEDMEFGYWSTNQRAWRDLVLQPKPLTDRIWANIQPKLIPLLETNREERMEAEREERKHKRLRRLQQLFQEIKNESSSVLELKAQNPVTHLSSTVPTVSFTHREPFPNFAHAIKWPLFKDLHETDLSVADMETNFAERRGEVLALVTSWKDQIQSPFANRLREAYASKGEDLRATISISNEGSNLLANLSDDLKLLLRADSFFYKAVPSGLPKRPLSYSSILSNGGLGGSSSIYYGFLPAPPAPDPDKYHWYPEAHEAAQQLLADMGKPDTSYSAMAAVGDVFVCGRCHENEHRNWAGMVQHYIDQKKLHAKVHADKTSLSKKGIIYNDIHDPAVLTDRPMIMHHATKNVDRGANGFGRLQICKVCEKIPGIEAVFSMQGGIAQHLRDVHGIADAKAEEHYAPKNNFSSGLLGAGIYFDHDDYDSDDSYGMGYGCDCPYHSMLSHFDDEDDYLFGSGHTLYDDEDEDGYSDEYDYGW